MLRIIIGVMLFAASFLILTHLDPTEAQAVKSLSQQTAEPPAGGKDL